MSATCYVLQLGNLETSTPRLFLWRRVSWLRCRATHVLQLGKEKLTTIIIS